MGQVAGRLEFGAASNGKEPLRPSAGGGYGLVSGQPASVHPRPARPFDRDDAGPLCLLRHIGQFSTNKLVRLSGREDLAEMVVAAGSREPAPLEPIHSAPKASPSASSPDRPSLHLRERNSSMKNRKRESCTSGTVRDEDGNILIYSARHDEPIHALWRPASEKRQGTKSRDMG